MADKSSESLLTIARMYYVQRETMDAIAHHMNVSRSTVSRLLKEARDRGLVRVTVVDPDRPMGRIADLFRRYFNVTAHIVQVRPGASSVFRLEQVSRTAADLLLETVHDGDVLGVAWGTTTSAIASHLRPRERHGVTVIGLNGGANHQTTGLPYVGSILHRFAEAFNGQEQLLALPAFFDDPSTRDAMWREQSTQHILKVRDQCRVALFGVGGLNSELQSHVYASNYLGDDDLLALREQGVVGDVCTVMLREDGSYRDIALNARATGMTPRELQHVPRRLCVVTGLSKAAPILGALRAGVATDLIIDQETARAVLTRMKPGLRLS